MEMEIHDAGIAVQVGEGVCEAQTAIYNRMCNLAGIPTYGQIGHSDGEHIWSIHLDEDGNIFYVDSTTLNRPYSEITVEERTMEAFMEIICEKLMKCALEEGTFNLSFDFYDFLYDNYFWEKKYHKNYIYDRTAEEIIAFHQKLTS